MKKIDLSYISMLSPDKPKWFTVEDDVVTWMHDDLKSVPISFQKIIQDEIIELLESDGAAYGCDFDCILSNLDLGYCKYGRRDVVFDDGIIDGYVQNVLDKLERGSYIVNDSGNYYSPAAWQFKDCEYEDEE